MKNSLIDYHTDRGRFYLGMKDDGVDMDTVSSCFKQAMRLRAQDKKEARLCYCFIVGAIAFPIAFLCFLNWVVSLI